MSAAREMGALSSVNPLGATTDSPAVEEALTEEWSSAEDSDDEEKLADEDKLRVKV